MAQGLDRTCAILLEIPLSWQKAHDLQLRLRKSRTCPTPRACPLAGPQSVKTAFRCPWRPVEAARGKHGLGERHLPRV